MCSFISDLINCPQKQHLPPVDTGLFGAYLDDVDDDESRRLALGASKSVEAIETGVNNNGRCSGLYELGFCDRLVSDARSLISA